MVPVSKKNGQGMCDKYIKDLEKYMEKVYQNFSAMDIKNVSAKAEMEREINSIAYEVTHGIQTLQTLKTKFK